MGYYEDSHFLAPTRYSSVLKMIEDNDGFDVGRRLGFKIISGQLYSMY